MRNFISLRHPPLLRHRRDDEERDYTTYTKKSFQIVRYYGWGQATQYPRQRSKI